MHFLGGSTKTYADIRSSEGRLDIINDFISGKEHKGIRIVFEVLDDGKGSLQVNIIVTLPWLISRKTFVGEWGIDINNHIDSSGIEDACAKIMVEGWIDIVYSNSIDTCYP
jgi:hypothetical protein